MTMKNRAGAQVLGVYSGTPVGVGRRHCVVGSLSRLLPIASVSEHGLGCSGILTVSILESESHGFEKIHRSRTCYICGAKNGRKDACLADVSRNVLHCVHVVHGNSLSIVSAKHSSRPSEEVYT
ncbi:hypothetical protein AVEN_59905-1 [Araneus ventricosus]|uniref:Uncharacterized protein n=1 Tax=Araneus ventricosus TaxID=182803 RepID=A0A4Y2EF41_ARAVE|nr:hypothetical protein AVEN_59905-1 [Araneus ventricosus]